MKWCGTSHTDDLDHEALPTTTNQVTSQLLHDTSAQISALSFVIKDRRLIGLLPVIPDRARLRIHTMGTVNHSQSVLYCVRVYCPAAGKLSLMIPC